MNIERNKSDFEKAMKNADKILSGMRGIVDKLIDRIEEMIGEYENHYKHDIEELIIKNAEMEDQISSLEDIVSEYRK